MGTIVGTRDAAIKVTGKVPTVKDIMWWEMGRQARKQMQEYIYVRES